MKILLKTGVFLGILTNVWGFLFCTDRFLLAEDTVRMRSRRGGEIKISGTVLDYTGEELVLEKLGVKKSYPGEDIISVDSQWTAEQREADAAVAQGDWLAALAKYETAVRVESRRWVRRLLLARLVDCHRQLNRLEPAGDLFLVLVAEDPKTPWFDSIPLVWLADSPTPALQTRAKEWLQRQELSAAVLLGASHLLATSDQAEARGRLEELAQNPDERIATLARLQLWRVQRTTTNLEQLALLTREVEKLSESLRAGGYFLVGQMAQRNQQFQQAALAFLRVVVLYPRESRLVSRALLESGICLEKLGQSAEAARLYEELRSAHPQSADASEAESRLQDITSKSREAP